MRHGCLSILLALTLLIVLPLIYADLLSAALLRLQLGPATALVLVLSIFAGSLVNVPVRRIVKVDPVVVDPMAIFGLHGIRPSVREVRHVTVIAVNVGGCLIPAGLALQQVVGLMVQGTAVIALLVAVTVNVLVCYRLARPVEGVGITLPALIPAAVAAGVALLMAPGHATQVAFVAGVLGPLAGADLLNLHRVRQLESGMVSIGGAGTFDGILLSGIVALFLA